MSKFIKALATEKELRETVIVVAIFTAMATIIGVATSILI
jgi:hypothetical protein